MIFKVANAGLDITKQVIQMIAQLMIGVIMVFFVGLPLVLGGVLVGLVPLAIGAMAWISLYQTYNRFKQKLP